MRKILLLEKHPILMRGFQQVLEGIDPNWEVLAADKLDALDARIYPDIDLVVLSLPLEPERLAAELADARRVTHPARMLLLCDVIDGEFPDIPSLENVCGYVSKSASVALLEATVKVVMAGGECFPGPARMESRAGDDGTLSMHDGEESTLAVPLDSIDAELLNITPRQYEVLLLLSRGYPIKSVSRMLNISVATAKTHAYKLYRTLNVRNKSEAVYEALRRGATLDWMPARPVTFHVPTAEQEAEDELAEFERRQSALF